MRAGSRRSSFVRYVKCTLRTPLSEPHDGSYDSRVVRTTASPAPVSRDTDRSRSHAESGQQYRPWRRSAAPGAMSCAPAVESAESGGAWSESFIEARGANAASKELPFAALGWSEFTSDPAMPLPGERDGAEQRRLYDAGKEVDRFEHMTAPSTCTAKRVIMGKQSPADRRIAVWPPIKSYEDSRAWDERDRCRTSPANRASSAQSIVLLQRDGGCKDGGARARNKGPYDTSWPAGVGSLDTPQRRASSGVLKAGPGYARSAREMVASYSPITRTSRAGPRSARCGGSGRRVGKFDYWDTADEPRSSIDYATRTGPWRPNMSRFVDGEVKRDTDRGYWNQQDRGGSCEFGDAGSGEDRGSWRWVDEMHSTRCDLSGEAPFSKRSSVVVGNHDSRRWGDSYPVEHDHGSGGGGCNAGSISGRGDATPTAMAINALRDSTYRVGQSGQEREDEGWQDNRWTKPRSAFSYSRDCGDSDGRRDDGRPAVAYPVIF